MTTLKYGLEDRPPNTTLPWLSLQHILTMLGATIAVPTILAGVYGLDTANAALLISNVLLAMGVATLLQVSLGSRLPIVQGSSFAFLPALIYVAALYPGVEGLQYAMGAILAGGIFQLLLGLTKVAGLLQKVLTPVVVGPTILAIGLSLFSVGGSQASTNWWLSGLTATLILVFSFGLRFFNNTKSRSFLSMFPVVLAIALVWVGCLILSVAGVFPPESAGYVDLSNVGQNGFLKTSGFIFPWGFPKFDLAFLLIFLIAYLVSTVESIGDYNAINEIATDGDSEVTPQVVNRGVMAEGLGCVLSSLFGGVSTTSYGENIGVVGITRVASRVVVLVAGIFLIIIGLVPVISGVLATIPTPIMGGLYCVLFGMIAGVGLRYAARANLLSMRNVSIIGLSLFVGFAIPSVFGAQEAKDQIISVFGQGFGDTLLGVLTSSMAVTTFTALLWDNLLKKEA